MNDVCNRCGCYAYPLKDGVCIPCATETLPEKLARLIRENPGMPVKLQIKTYLPNNLNDITEIGIGGYLPNKAIVITIGTV